MTCTDEVFGKGTSTLSTTANIYAHLTQPAAHDAVNTIDTTLTQADTEEENALPENKPHLRRPQRDHRARHRPPLKRAYSPTTIATSPTASRPKATTCDHHATTRRKNTKKPSSRIRENGLRPAKTQSGRQDLNLRPLDPQRRALVHSSRSLSSVLSRVKGSDSSATPAVVSGRHDGADLPLKDSRLAAQRQGLEVLDHKRSSAAAG